jgi:hypothetical protein
MRKITIHKVTIIAIAIVLLLSEGLMRLVEAKLSGNINHMQEIPDVIERHLRSDPNVNAAKVIFLGNSLTNNAVDEERFNHSSVVLEGKKSSAVKIVPDATYIWDWYCVFKNNIYAQDKPPEAVIVGFAWAQLSDRRAPQISRLAGYFCGMSDLGDLLSLGMDDISDVLEFSISKLSHLYVNRETIRKRLLDIVIPDYRQYTQYINDFSVGIRNQGVGVEEKNSYRILKKMIQKAEQKNIRMVFMSMPVIKDYSIDRELLEIFEDNSVTFFDMRKVTGINESMYLDPIHLDENGREIFTDQFIAKTKGHL